MSWRFLRYGTSWSKKNARERERERERVCGDLLGDNS